MSPACPLPYCPEDGVIDLDEDLLADNMPMVVRPSLDSGIKTRYQLGCGQRLRVPNNSPDTLQEHANALSRGLNEQLSISILAHILSKEIKAILYMCDDRFIGREFE